jgi:hypothetical protein
MADVRPDFACGIVPLSLLGLAGSLTFANRTTMPPDHPIAISAGSRQCVITLRARAGSNQAATVSPRPMDAK